MITGDDFCQGMRQGLITIGLGYLMHVVVEDDKVKRAFEEMVVREQEQSVIS